MKKIFWTILSLLIISKSAVSQTQSPGLDVLGYGYDVFGQYADQKSKKRYCLFQYNDFQTVPIGSNQYSVPKYVILENISNHITKTVQGESLREYAKNQSGSVGLSVDAMFFSGSVNSSFSGSSSGSERHFYYTYRDANTKWRISFDERNLEALKTILDPQFKKDLESLEPSKLFELYGTHYIASAYLGGRADFNSTSVITSNTNTSEISVAVEAKYKVVSGNVSLSQKNSETLSNSKTTTKLTVTGGNSEYANNISDPVTYEKWASGISDMPVLCDFDNNSLRPIWDFCASTTRKALLKAEFEKMCRANPLPDKISAAISVSNQVFFISPAGHDDLLIDIGGYHFDADNNKGAEVLVWAKDNKENGLQGIDHFIKAIPHATDPQYVYLLPQHSDLVFDVTGASKSPGTGIQLWEKGNNNLAQKFKLLEVDGKKNTYYIINENSGLYLTFNGDKKQITQENKTEAENQQWVFKPASAGDMASMPLEIVFSVKNVKAKRYMDLPGAGGSAQTKDGHIQLWDMDYDPDRYAQLLKSNIDGWYYVQQMNGNYVWDMEGGQKSNGTKLQLWDQNNLPAQQFKFIYAGSPMTFYIENRGSEKYLDASDSNIDKNGCPVQIWDKHGKENQQWRLYPVGPKWYAPEYKKVKVKMAYSNKYWDLSGSGDAAKVTGSQLQIWDMDDGIDRYFIIKRSGDADWVNIEFEGGMRVDVKGGEIKTDRAKLQTWTAHGGDAQKFAIKPTGRNTCLIFSKGWKALDAEGGGINENGPDIILWGKHYGKSQQFQLIDVETGKPIEFDKIDY